MKKTKNTQTIESVRKNINEHIYTLVREFANGSIEYIDGHDNRMVITLTSKKYQAASPEKKAALNEQAGNRCLKWKQTALLLKNSELQGIAKWNKTQRDMINWELGAEYAEKEIKTRRIDKGMPESRKTQDKTAKKYVARFSRNERIKQAESHDFAGLYPAFILYMNSGNRDGWDKHLPTLLTQYGITDTNGSFSAYCLKHLGSERGNRKNGFKRKIMKETTFRLELLDFIHQLIISNGWFSSAKVETAKAVKVSEWEDEAVKLQNELDTAKAEKLASEKALFNKQVSDEVNKQLEDAVQLERVKIRKELAEKHQKDLEHVRLQYMVKGKKVQA